MLFCFYHPFYQQNYKFHRKKEKKREALCAKDVSEGITKLVFKV